jgi:hypothetical protein
LDQLWKDMSDDEDSNDIDQETNNEMHKASLFELPDFHSSIGQMISFSQEKLFPDRNPSEWEAPRPKGGASGKCRYGYRVGFPPHL